MVTDWMLEAFLDLMCVGYLSTWMKTWMKLWMMMHMDELPPPSLSLSSTLSQKNCRRIDSYVEFLQPEPTIASQVRRISSTNSRNRFALVVFFFVFSPPSKILWRMFVGRFCLFRRRIFVSEKHLCVCVFFMQFSKVLECFWRPCWKNWNTISLFFFYHLLMCRMFICVGIFRACLELSIGDQFFLGRETNFRYKFGYNEECMCWIGGLWVELSTEERELFLLESS